MAKENFLNIKEIVQKLRVSEHTIMRYIKAKRLNASKIGQWRVKATDIDCFIDQNSNKKN